MINANLTAAPFVSQPIEIEDAWIDYNGHLNMAYYLVIFERAFDDFHFELGTDLDYVKSRKKTLYTGQTKLNYLREVHKGAKLTPTCQILDFDKKRIHTWQELIHQDGEVAATCETLTLHIDMTGPKVAPFPDYIFKNIQIVAAAHKTIPIPADAKKPIAIVRSNQVSK